MLSTNQKANMFQAMYGFFLYSNNTPEKVIQICSHGGISISTTSVQQMIRSLSFKAETHLWKAFHDGVLAAGYDNFDMTFPVAEPTTTHQTAFQSMTSGTFIPMHKVSRDDLCCGKEVWAANPLNPNPTHPLKQINAYELLLPREHDIHGLTWNGHLQ